VPKLLQLAAAVQERTTHAKLPTEALEQAGALLCALLLLLSSLKALDRPTSASDVQLPFEVRTALGTLAESFRVQPELILGFAALAVGDLDGIADLASRVCEFDPVRMRALLAAVDTARAKANAVGAAAHSATTMQDGVVKLNTPQEIFVYFDADRSGVMVRGCAQRLMRALCDRPSRARSTPSCPPPPARSQDLDEFEEVIKNMGINISRQRAMLFFAKADADSDGTINMDEFEKAYEYLQRELTFQTLRDLSLTSMAIVGALSGLLGFVALVFVFIFFGVSAFSGGSPFEGVVNSLMPLSTGALAGGQSKIDPKEKLEEATKAVEAMLERLGETD
jgi:hypothetical protein